MTVGGHAFVALGGLATCLQLLYATQPRGWVMKLMDREPIVFFSCVLTGVSMVCVSRLVLP